MGDPMPHEAISEVFPDVFFVRGAFRAAPGVQFSRSMTILRHGRDLALVNAFRLTPAGEDALAALGEVRHVVRIGAFHGSDDHDLVRRYAPKVWGLPGGRHPDGLKIDSVYDEVDDGSAPLPIPGVRVVRFKNARIPEAVLWHPAGGGTLVSCDSAQNNCDTLHASLLTQPAIRWGGFWGPANCSPPWRFQMQARGGASLGDDYRRILALPFENLLPGHGPPLIGGARGHLERTVARLWG